MNGTKRAILIALSIALLSVFAVGTAHSLYEDFSAKKSYDKSAELAGLPDELDELYLQQSDPKEESSVTDADTPSEEKDTKEEPTGEGDEGADSSYGDNDTDNDTDTAELPDTPDPDGEKPELLPVTVPGDQVALGLRSVDVAALKKINPQVTGWLYLPQSEISYPVVQGTDNSHYLKYTWEGERNKSGAIFTDYRCDAELSDFNTVIYGHKMSNGSMFGSLEKFADPEYMNAHTYIYAVTENSVKRYRIFSAYESDVETGRSYELSFSGLEGMQSFVDHCVENSVVDSGYVPHSGARILTLSTCTKSTVYDYKTRWVVHAALDQELYF